MGKLRFKDIAEAELDAFIARVEEAIEYELSLDKNDLALLLEAFKACLFLQEKLSENSLTILKLKNLLVMVKSSEKLRKLMDDGDKSEAQGKDKSEDGK